MTIDDGAPAGRKSTGSAFETTNPQILRTRASIIRSTCRLLINEGYRGITIEKVSADSGASRTTIYRHWPKIEGLLFDAFSQITGTPFESPNTGDYREDLFMITQQGVELLTTTNWLKLLPSFIEASQHDPDCAVLLEELVEYMRSTSTDILIKAQAEGQLDSEAKVDWIVDAIIGPVFYRGLLTKRPIDEEGYLRFMIDSTISNATS